MRPPMTRSAVLIAITCWAAVVEPARAIDLLLTTENDFLNRTTDDLYTFGFAVAVERDPYVFTIRQDAFTDKKAGARFDETRVTVMRGLTGGDWLVNGGGGVVHVGHGLLDQDFQNWFHRQIGSDQLALEYVDASLHPLLRIEAERRFELTESLRLGPRFEVETAPGLRSHAVAGAAFGWWPSELLGLEGLAGTRFST